MQKYKYIFHPRNDELKAKCLLPQKGTVCVPVPNKWIRNSFISFFYKTPPNIVCPHFWVLKPFVGCPYHCSYCYLQGTFFGNKAPRLKDLDKAAEVLKEFFSWCDTVGIKLLLNMGELCDCFAIPEWTETFLKKILPLLEEHPGNKLLLLSKAGRPNIDFLLKNSQFRKFIIVSFSLNPEEVINNFEKGTAPLNARLEAIKALEKRGYRIRIRIDPMIPIDGWKNHYSELLAYIFERFRLHPERITVGSLRGLYKTIYYAKDREWVKYLDKKEKTGWGLKIKKRLREELYTFIFKKILEQRNFKGDLALCKETPQMWKLLEEKGLLYDPGEVGIWNNVKCNCKF